jgi:hypothetical protein
MNWEILADSSQGFFFFFFPFQMRSTQNITGTVARQCQGQKEEEKKDGPDNCTFQAKRMDRMKGTNRVAVHRSTWQLRKQAIFFLFFFFFCNQQGSQTINELDAHEAVISQGKKSWS